MGGKGAERQVWEGRWGNSAGGWLVFPTSPWWCPGVVKGGQTAVIWEGWGVPAPHISAGHNSLGVTLLPAPKSRLHPEPAGPAGQGAPCQCLPPAPAGTRGQVGRGRGCHRARPWPGHGVPGSPLTPVPAGRGPRGRGARSAWRTSVRPACRARWGAWWRCSPTAPASWSCSGPRMAPSASSSPLGMAGPTQVPWGCAKKKKNHHFGGVKSQ